MCRLLMLLVVSTAASAYSEQDVECLAEVITAEARGEPLTGQIAVGYALLNRASDGKSLCWHSRHGFTRTRAKREQRHAAWLVLYRHTDNPIGSRMFFDSHAKPHLKGACDVKQIGKHLFYTIR